MLVNLAGHLKNFTKFPVYAFIAGAYPILLLFSHNQKELKLNELVIPLVVSVFITSCLLLILKLIYRSWHKAALLSLFLLLTLFSYGYIVEFLQDYLYPYINLNKFSFGEDKILFSLFFALAITVTVKLWLTRHQLISVTSILNATFIVVAIFPIYTVVSIILSPSNLSLKNNEVQALTSKISEKPDIYYLIFDKYGSNEMLQEYYDFDNSKWNDFLDTEGFYVVHNARTNYPKTSFSLASSLNMDYLQTFKPEVSDDREEVSIAFPLLQHPKVAKILQSAGYKYIHVSSWFEPTKTSEIANEVVNYENDRFNLTRFQKLIMNQSALAPILDKFLTLSDYDQQLVGLEYQFSHMPEIIKRNGPKFVVMHAILPHEPAVFDMDCNKLSVAESISRPKVQNYTEHVECANKQAEKIINDIKMNDPASIIIFQSDEGPIDYLYGMKDDYNFENAGHDSKMIRSGIQMAFYYPDGAYSNLYQGMTPVNIFRSVFNQYFEENYKMLPDIVYAMKSRAKLFEFMDLTSEMTLKD